MTPLVATTIFTCLGLALALACVRLVRGPTVADRVVALEVIASILIGVLASYAVFFCWCRRRWMWRWCWR